MEDWNEINRSLLAVAMQVSPTGVQQRGFANLANVPMDGKWVALALIDGMVDGLRYGNWPEG